jgi:hypothetical protein
VIKEILEFFYCRNEKFRRDGGKVDHIVTSYLIYTLALGVPSLSIPAKDSILEPINRG